MPSFFKNPRTAGTFLAASFIASASVFTSYSVQAQPSKPSRNPKNFLADTVEIAQPSLVSVRAKQHTFLGEMESGGSGFFLDKQGFIATNAHVVKLGGGQHLTCTLANGKEYPAFVFAVDPESDLALLKLQPVFDTNDVVPGRIGKSAELRTGDWVVAMGSPLNLQNSVTVGIVSAPSRRGKDLGLTSRSPVYIQTDCAINSGNSGGPLVNIEGEIVGITTMKAERMEGVSFSIGIDFAMSVLEDLKVHKRVLRPFLGFRMVSVTKELVQHARWQEIGLPREWQEDGVLVVQIQPKSPAENAGLKENDLIVGVDGEKIADTTDLLAKLKVGRQVKLNIRRGKAELVLEMTPSEKTLGN